MKIIRSLLALCIHLSFTTLLLGIIGGIGFLAFRETWFNLTLYTLKSSTVTLQRVVSHSHEYHQKCAQRNGVTSGSAISRLQLRFLSSTRYNIEVVCLHLNEDPLIISTHSLLPFVAKQPGSTGLIWGDTSTGFVIEILGQQRTVRAEKNTIEYTKVLDDPLSFPLSTCESYGYVCCRDDLEMGHGGQYTEANNCPKSCYAVCASIPIVLFFETEPVPEDRTKQLVIGQGEIVTFHYVIGFVGADANTSVQVSIDFGDGQGQVLDTLQGEVSHKYTCPSPSCQYTANIVASSDQRRSTITPLTIRHIEVR